MAEELNWTAARKQQEMVQTTRFLQSMGLPLGAAVPTRALSSQDWYDWIYHKLDSATAKKAAAATTATTTTVNSGHHGRAQFGPGEADALREAFLERSRDSAGRLAKLAIRELLQGIPTYAGIRTKDFEYVLEETGLAKQKDIDVDEFVEVRSHIPPPPSSV